MYRMKSRIILIVTILAIIGYSVQAEGHDPNTTTGCGEYKAGELLVKFAPKANHGQRTKAEKANILQSLGGGSFKRHFRIVPGLTSVKLPPGLTVEKALERYNKRSDILYAQPNHLLKASAIPNDTIFGELWGMHNTGQGGGAPDADIDAPEAWEIAHDAKEIVVAEIDTGVDYTHPDLAANMWVNEAELYGTPGVDDDDPNNGYVDDIYGYDFCTYGGKLRDSDPMDDKSHGTHVAGTIGAVGNNSLGVTGVCWDVKIMALKFMDWRGAGCEDDAIACIEYAIENGAKVLNNSWGYRSDTFCGEYISARAALRDAISAADAADILFVAAAGNDSASPALYPASYNLDNIISVMATDRDDKKRGASNYGSVSVDLGAPGTDIRSTRPYFVGGYYSYDLMSGTSMAAPHVAGACALVWSLYPDLTHYEVKQRVLDGVVRINSLDGKCVTGGRLNLYNALNAPKGFELSMTDDLDPADYSLDPLDSERYTVTYTISYSNSITDETDPNWYGDLENVTIINNLPAGLEPLEIDVAGENEPYVSGGLYDREAGTITWDNISPLGPGDTNSISVACYITEEVPSGGDLINEAILSHRNVYRRAAVTIPVVCFNSGIIYVKADAPGPAHDGMTWHTAYTDLQDALARARNGCGNTIWVAAGTYKPATMRNMGITFEMIEGVRIYGGFAGDEQSLSDRDYIKNPTILSGDIDPHGHLNPYSDHDNLNVVTARHGIWGSAVLDGFTITGAREAGIYCAEDTSSVINPIIRNCVITKNGGDGIYCDYADPNIINCVITGNGGNGIYIKRNEAMTVDRCIIAENYSGGIRLNYSDEATVTNCLIHNNGGDGVFFDNNSSGLKFRNNTIVYNNGDGFSCQGSCPTMTNCIFWGNTGSNISGCSPTYSCFPGASGTNTGDNPDFVSPGLPDHDYHLQYNSDCVETGDPYCQPAPGETDIDGNPRIIDNDDFKPGSGGRVDMGADEVACSDFANPLDFDLDGIVDLAELNICIQAWLTVTNDPNWDQRCDLDTSDMIDYGDFDLFAGNWLDKTPCDPEYGSAASMLQNAEQASQMAMTQPISTVEATAAPALTTEEQIDQLGDNIEWLEYLWQNDEELNTTIDEDQWLDFMDSVYDILDELQSQ